MHPLKAIGNAPFVVMLSFVMSVGKLTGIIEWSWLVVLAPVWVPLCLAIVLWTLALAVSEFFNEKLTGGLPAKEDCHV